MANYIITLQHTETIKVNADNRNDALSYAYKNAECNCIWNFIEIEEVDEDE